MSNDDQFSYTTKLWKRSQNSYASTIPQSIMAIKGAPTGDDAVVHWKIDPDNGRVYVEFDTKQEDEDDE